MDFLLKCLTILMVVTTAISTQPKTVLFFPPPLSSYLVYHQNVAGALASLGHKIWLVVPHFMVQEGKIKDKNLNVLEYGQSMGNIERQIYQKSRIVESFWEGHPPKEMDAAYEVGKVTAIIARELLADQSFLNKLRDLKPDLLVIESVPFNLNMVVIPYMLEIPFALIGTLHDVVISKVPFSPATNPFPSGYVSDRMTFWQRVQSTRTYLTAINFDIFTDSSLVSDFVPNKPYKSINELASRAEIFIPELDYILDYPRVTLPNTKLIGGSSASPAKPLTGEYKEFVDKVKTGFIVVSFGASVVNIPVEIFSKMSKAFGQLDLSVVWRVNNSSPDPSKILTSLWMPQNDLLGHEKAKLFISHCGKNGQYEALFHAVPILCLPIYGDQTYNSYRIFVKKFGLYTDMRTVSAQDLADMITEIVYRGNYTDNIRRASRLYRELYKVPKQEAAYWLDHVLQYGSQHLRSSGQDMTWYQLYALDVIAFLLSVVIGVLIIIYLIIRMCIRLFNTKARNAKSKKE